MHADAKPVLVAVDFSSHSERALEWALEAARRFDAPLVVLHVVHDSGSAPGHYAGKHDGPQLLEEVAQELMDDFLQRFREARPGQTFPKAMRTRLVVGLPANRVIEVAEAEGAQLIVVGSQGRSALAQLLLGSKAERIAMLSPVPVTIVH